VLGNRIPEIHELVHHGNWEEASRLLHATDNFPEFTGRLCGQRCQLACAQGHTAHAVPIRQVECHVVERAFAEGWIQPVPAVRRSGKKVVVVGSGPAGLSLAQQLARAGHEVVVYEHHPLPGGALRQCPDGGLDPYLIDRRLRQLAAEGVEFVTDVLAGLDLRGGYLRRHCDALCLTLPTLDLITAGDATPDSGPPALGLEPSNYHDLIAQLDLRLAEHGRVATGNYGTSQSGIFAVDDLGADLSLVEVAIRNGREAAAVMDLQLSG
jgi:glutamate synthase (NADPH/NADH) small chain